MNQQGPYLFWIPPLVSKKEESKLTFSERKQIETSICSPAAATLLDVQKNIPYSLGLRIVRICTNPEVKDIRLNELKNLLLSRNYPERLVDSALDKARKVPRHIALKTVIRKIEKPK